MLRGRVWRCTRCWVRLPISPQPLTTRPTVIPRRFYSAEAKASQEASFRSSPEENVEPKKSTTEKDSKEPKSTAPKQRKGIFSFVRDELSYIQEHYSTYYHDEDTKTKEWNPEKTIAKYRNKEPVADGKTYTTLAVERQRERERIRQEAGNVVAEEEEKPDTGEPKVFYAPMVIKKKTTVWDQRKEAMKDWLMGEVTRKVVKTQRAVQQSDSSIMEQARKIADAARQLQDNWETSQNPLVWKIRDAYDKVSDVSDVGRTLERIIMQDPTFETVSFLQHLKQYMIPVVLERFLSSDLEFMELVTDEDALREARNQIQLRRKTHVWLHPEVVHIRGLDIATAQTVRDMPLLYVTWVCQHLDFPTNEKGEVMKDKPANTKLYFYAWNVRRDLEMEDFNWRIVTWQSGEIKALEGGM